MHLVVGGLVARHVGVVHVQQEALVPGGVLVQFSAGDTCSPACVYFTGIGSPSGQAGVVSVIAGRGG